MMYLMAELETARGTASDQRCLVTTLAYSLYTSGPTAKGLAVVAEEYTLPGSPAPSPLQRLPHDT